MSQIDELLKVANITEDEILNGVEPGDDIITLRSANGEDIDFIEIAGIAHEGKFYLIMQPVELLDGMDDDDDYYDDYTEDKNVETTPSATEQPRISLDSLGGDIITGTIDFGDPNAPEHQNDWDTYTPSIDMSGWDVTIH